MSNAELIERLNKPCGRTTGHGESCSVGWLCGACADKAKAADALELADKRIAELEKYGRVQDPLADRIAELEHKLSVAREALSAMWLHYKQLVDSGDAGNWTPEDEPVCKQAIEALAQIGGDE